MDVAAEVMARSCCAWETRVKRQLAGFIRVAARGRIASIFLVVGGICEGRTRLSQS